MIMKKFFMNMMIFLGCILASHLIAAPIFIQTVPVGDPKNAADPLTGYGSVQEDYRIGKTEVTALQYCAFLNAVAKQSDGYGLYNSKMGSDTNVASIQRIYDQTNKCYLYTTDEKTENFPITYVSWSSAARFCNWMHNNCREGNEGPETTERGAYDLNGFMGGVVPLAKGATWFIPTEDQWYKAAYYKAGGTNAGYWLYPTKSNLNPDNSMTGNMTNNANVFLLKKERNWFGMLINKETYAQQSGPPFLTSVDAFVHSEGPYRTYDMGGNVFEWVDADRTELNPDDQVIRGGAWSKEFGIDSLKSTYRKKIKSFSETSTIGFRVATQAQYLNLSWVEVGDPDNPPDPVTGCGAVHDAFRIGKYPITVQQYCFFLNSVAGNGDPYGLYCPRLWTDMVNGSIVCTPFAGRFYYSVRPGREKFPASYISWFDAARFCNWLHNNCPEGDEDDSTTETGAYTLKGRNDIWGTDMIVEHNENARYYIPTEDQWYKAAYYDGHGGYNKYPTRHDVAPGNCIGGKGDQANYNYATKGSAYAPSGLTPVGLFSDTKSYYGAYDMGGNVWEWNNTATIDWVGLVHVKARGGSFKMDASTLTKEKFEFFLSGENQCGFRVASPAN